MTFISILLSLAYFGLISFIYWHWGAGSKPKKNALVSGEISFTIVIPMRNEEENISHCIKSVLACQYPTLLYEIIVVDDHSTDDSLPQASSFEGSIKIVRASGFGKKNAITEGVLKGKNEFIITLDADCTVPKSWLESIANKIQNYPNASIIVNPVRIDSVNSLLAAFEFMDTAVMMATSCAGIMSKKFYLANGANLVFSKTLFHQINGYEGNDQIASGDDVFLINKAIQSNFTSVYNKALSSTVSTKSAPSWSALIQQRKRWATKTMAYVNKYLLLVQTIVFVYCFFIVFLLFLSIIYQSYLQILAYTFLFKALVDFLFLKNLTSYFEGKGVMKYYFLNMFIYPFVLILMGVFALIPTKYEWKNRSQN